jgi:transcriptional regulator with XRE-family HTH domain
MIPQDTIRNRTKHRRLLFGITQALLAKDARVDRSVFSQWETGMIDLSDEQLGRIESSLLSLIADRLNSLSGEFAEVATT